MLVSVIVLSCLLCVSVIINVALVVLMIKRSKQKPSVAVLPPVVLENNNALPSPKKNVAKDKNREEAELIKVQGMSREEVLRSEIDQAPPETKVRSDRQKLAEPVGRVEFDNYMKLAINFLNDYNDESHKQSVIPETETGAKIKDDAPEKSDKFTKIIEDVKKIVVPNMCHNQHPRYHAGFDGTCLADILACTLSSFLVTESNSSPVIDVLERLLCRWIASVIGLPKMRKTQSHAKVEKDPVGTMFYNSTDVFLSIILSCKSKDIPLSNCVVYTSDDGNYALEEACILAKVRLRKVVTFTKHNHCMTGARLKKQIIKDVERKLHPLIVVANFGSPNLGINDKLEEIIDIAKEYNMWVHCDASYAGLEWTDVSKRCKIHSMISEISSIHVNMSTLIPFGGQVRILWAAEKVILDHPRYRGNRNGSDVIRLWILLRLYGVRSIKDTVKRKVTLGNMLGEKISQLSEFVVVYPNEHGIVLFQYNNKTIKDRTMDINLLTSMFYSYITESSQMKFALVKFQGKTLIRACINYERSNASMIEESVSTLLNMVDEFEEKMKSKKNGLKLASASDYVDMIGGSPNLSTDKTQESFDLKSINSSQM